MGFAGVWNPVVARSHCHTCFAHDKLSSQVRPRVPTSGICRFSDHRPGFGSTARQGGFFPRIFRDFPGFFGILRYISLFFGILRNFSARAAPVAGTQPRAQGTARHLKAPPGRAVRFSACDQH